MLPIEQCFFILQNHYISLSITVARIVQNIYSPTVNFRTFRCTVSLCSPHFADHIFPSENQNIFLLVCTLVFSLFSTYLQGKEINHPVNGMGFWFTCRVLHTQRRKRRRWSRDVLWEMRAGPNSSLQSFCLTRYLTLHLIISVWCRLLCGTFKPVSLVITNHIIFQNLS